jgi:hypothetical protein
MAFMDRAPCPKCNRSLAPSGEVTIGVSPSRTFLTYQCDECTALVTMFGEPQEVALTFCVDEHGHAFDPATPEGKLPIYYSSSTTCTTWCLRNVEWWGLGGKASYPSST